MRAAAETPGRLASAVMPGSEEAQPSVEALLSDVIRFADLILFRVEEASHAYEEALGTPEAEQQAARWRLDDLRRVTQIATGTNSIASLLDLVVYVTVFEWHVEDHWIPEVAGEVARPLQIALAQSRADGWILAERHLPASELASARALLDDWRRAHPVLEREILLEFPSFLAMAGEAGDASGASSSLLGIVGLDPLSGLEPAARQIEETRLFGLRALFFLQRAPRLVAAESEFRLLSMRASPEVQQILDDTQRITGTLEHFAATAAALPEQVRVEREAAVAQIAAELGAQRAAFVADLEHVRAPLEGLLGETRATLEAGTRMSAELTAAVTALDAFVGRFERPAAPAAEEKTPKKPFEVADYGVAAERVAHAAAELNALVSALDTRLPEAERLLDAAAARGDATIERVFRRALVLGLVLIAAAAAAALLVRRMGRGSTRAV